MTLIYCGLPADHSRRRGSDDFDRLAGAQSAGSADKGFHPVTENIAVFDDDVALVDTNAEINAALGCYREVSLGHLCLNFARALERVYGAGEFGQQTVAGRLDDSTIMGRNARINQLGADGSQAPQGCPAHRRRSAVSTQLHPRRE